MITYTLLLIVIGILGLIASPISLLPDAVLPAGITAALSTIGYWFWIVWSTAPLTLAAIFAALVIVIGVETKIFSYKVVRWIYQKVPGIN